MSNTREHEPKRAVILLVEDSPADQVTIERSLEDGRVQCELFVVENGEQALAWLHYDDPITHPKPDLILMDINMPVMDGITALKKIRADSHLKTIPVIMLTTSDTGRDVDLSYTEGANAFITKPVSEIAFVEAVVKLEQFWFELVTLPNTGP